MQGALVVSNDQIAFHDRKLGILNLDVSKAIQYVDSQTEWLEVSCESSQVAENVIYLQSKLQGV